MQTQTLENRKPAQREAEGNCAFPAMRENQTTEINQAVQQVSVATM